MKTILFPVKPGQESCVSRETHKEGRIVEFPPQTGLQLDNGICGITQEVNSLFNVTMPLRDYIETWLTVFKKNEVKASTYNRLQASLNALLDYDIASKPVINISFFDIQNYINQLTEHGYGLTTIKKQVQIVTAPLKQAASMRLIPSDPSIGIRMPSEARVKKQNKEVKAYTQTEQTRLWLQIEKAADVYAYCIGFMIETGLRIGEVMALRWKDVDLWQKKSIRVRATFCNIHSTGKMVLQENPKTKSSIRTIPITTKAASILQRVQMLSTSDYVFDKAGSPLSYKALVKHTKRLCQAAGIQYYGEHAFRHTFATNCYYKGIDVKILSKLMGHSSTEVTYNAYIHLYEDGFDEMYQALNG